MNQLDLSPLQDFHWVFMRGLVRESRHWSSSFIGRFSDMLLYAGVDDPKSRLHFFDLPGVGEKRQQRLKLDVRKQIADLADELAKRRPGNPLGFVGVSLGALVGLQWEAICPNTFERMILVNTSHVRVSPVFQRLRLRNIVGLLPNLFSLDPATSERAILELVCNREDLRQEILQEWVEIKQSAPWALRALVEQLLFALRAKWLPVARPDKYLVLGSLNDRLVDVSCSISLMQAIQASGSLHPTAGHDPSIDEPDWLCAEIFAWFAKSNLISLMEERAQATL